MPAPNFIDAKRKKAMQNTFKAMLLTQEEKRTHHEIVDLTQDALPEGDVLVAVEYSSLNYKDAREKSCASSRWCRA